MNYWWNDKAYLNEIGPSMTKVLLIGKGNKFQWRKGPIIDESKYSSPWDDRISSRVMLYLSGCLYQRVLDPHTLWFRVALLLYFDIGRYILDLERFVEGHVCTVEVLLAARLKKEIIFTMKLNWWTKILCGYNDPFKELPQFSEVTYLICTHVVKIAMTI